jgi:SET domain-containing protein
MNQGDDKDEGNDEVSEFDEQRIESPWFCVKTMGGTKGRGLVSTRPIPPHTVVHVAPCVLVTSEEYERHLKHTILEHYLFNARRGGRGDGKLLALGYGSLFNHSSKHPNVDYRVDATNSTITYRSGPRAIPAGVELCISYGCNLWFEEDDDAGDERDGEAAAFDDGHQDDGDWQDGLPDWMCGG